MVICLSRLKGCILEVVNPPISCRGRHGSFQWSAWKKETTPALFCSVLIEDELVGGIPTPLKNMKVSWDDYSQYVEK